jgi:glycosyltransferase involved in cell wall biosynthesis
VGAPQNRLFELAVRLQKKGVDITVLTAMPNYPQMKIHSNYRGKLRHYEEMDGLKIYRSWIFVKNSKSIFYRLLNYFSFVWTSFWSGWLRLGRFDFIICESPPLFLGITAFLLKKLKRSKLIFNVSDLWPESAEAIGVVKNKFLLNISYKLEKFLYKKSELITCQTNGIVDSIKKRFPDRKTFWLPNGVDINFFNPDTAKPGWRNENGFNDNDFILLYAGIIGHAYRFDIIIEAAQNLLNIPNIKFVIMGTGPLKEQVQEMIRNKGVTNVFLFDTLDKIQMPRVLRDINATIIPLKNSPLSKGTLPSKIFENLAMKKPVLLGVDGEAKNFFIDKGECGLYFEPENSSDLLKKILILYNDAAVQKKLGQNARLFVSENFNRDKLADNLWLKINELVNAKDGN